MIQLDVEVRGSQKVLQFVLRRTVWAYTVVVTNFNLLVAPEEDSRVRSSHSDSSPGDHECLCKIAWQLILIFFDISVWIIVVVWPTDTATSRAVLKQKNNNFKAPALPLASGTTKCIQDNMKEAMEEK